jgi:hypothetical protein
MLKSLIPGGKTAIYAIVALILVSLFFLWQGAKKDVKVVKAETTAVIVQKDAVIKHNGDEIAKLDTINKDNAEVVAVVKKSEEKVKESINKLDIATSKVTKAGTALAVEAATKVDSTKYISAESVAVLQKLVDEVEPLVYPKEDKVVTANSTEQVDVLTI